MPATRCEWGDRERARGRKPVDTRREMSAITLAFDGSYYWVQAGTSVRNYSTVANPPAYHGTSARKRRLFTRRHALTRPFSEADQLTTIASWDTLSWDCSNRVTFTMRFCVTQANPRTVTGGAETSVVEGVCFPWGITQTYLPMGMVR